MAESPLKLLYIASKSDPDNHDYLDAALTSAIFGQTVAVLFMGRGVEQLKTEQLKTGPRVDNPDSEPASTPIATLAEYGVEGIYVQREALPHCGMEENIIDSRGLCVDNQQIKQILARQDCVFNL